MNINEQKEYRQMISEEYGIKDPVRLGWMTQYAENHMIHEDVQNPAADASHGLYATPLNTLGAGNPAMPQGVGISGNDGSYIGNTSTDFHNPNYVNGSGDNPMSTLTMAMEIAAVTIGFDLVPVVPSPGPMAMLTYLDFPYAGGKLGRAGFETALDGRGNGDENKPIYIKVNAQFSEADRNKLREFTIMSDKLVTVSPFAPEAENHRAGLDKEPLTGTYSIYGRFVGFSRVDDNIIFQVKGVGTSKDDLTADYSIADVMRKATTVKVTDADGKSNEIPAKLVKAGELRAELVKGVTDHVQSFSNFFGKRDADGNLIAPEDETMTRAQNETGTGNTIGARMFSKMVQMGAYETTGTVTRQQLQDMPLYGIDVIGGVMEACQQEISQAINNRILDRVFKLGVENYKIQKSYQKADMNLYFGSKDTTKQLSDFSAWSKYVDINGRNPMDTTIMNATQNTSAENFITHQRRIMTRCLAVSNLISSVTRRGRAQWLVTNAQILSALQDCAGFVVAPMNNTLVQGGEESLYFAGTLAGLNVYVDPYMTWDDTRICVGRKASVTNNKVNGSGVVFMPYILADTVQIVAEGTMAPKVLVNSRFAIVDAGWYPEQNYYTFMVDFDEGYIL